MDEDHLQRLRQVALQTLRSKAHTHVPTMPSTQSVSLPHQMPTVSVNPLLQTVPMTAPRLATSLGLQGNMQMTGIPSMGMPSRAGINPAQLPPPPPPPGPPPPKQGSVGQAMSQMPYSVLGKLPTATVTPAGFVQAPQTQAGFGQAPQTQAGFGQAPPTQAGFVQASQTPAGFVQAPQARHNLYQLQGMPTASPVSIFSVGQTKQQQKAKEPSHTPEHTPEDRTSRRGDARFYKRSRSRSSYSRSASRSRSPRRRSRSSTYSHSRSSSYSTSASDYSTSTSSETDSSRSPSPVRKGRRKGRSHHRKDKEKLSARRKEKERRRRREKRKRKRRRERSPAERSEQSTPEPGYHSRPLYNSSVKDYSSPGKRPRSDLPRSSRDRRVDYAAPHTLPPPPLEEEYSSPLRLSGRLSPRPPRRPLPPPMDRMQSRMRRSDPPLHLRDQYPDDHFDLDYPPPVEDYSPSHYNRRMSPPSGGGGRNQNSPRRPRPRLGGRTGRGRDGRGDLRRAGLDGRGDLRGLGSDGWDNDIMRPYDVRNEIRWPEVRSEGRRPDNRGERRRLDVRSEGRRPDAGYDDRQQNSRTEGRRPDARSEGRQPDIRSDGRRMDFRIEGRRSDIRKDGRRPDVRIEGRQPETSNEGRRPDIRGEGRRPEMRGEDRRLDVRIDSRRSEMDEDGKLDARSEGRRPVGRSKHLTGRQGEGEEQHNRRRGRVSRDSRQDERLRVVPQREEEEQEKTNVSTKVSVSEEEPEGHSGHSHGEESVTDDGTRRGSHSDAEPSGGGKEKDEVEEEEEEEGLVQSSEEEEQGEANTEDSQEQSNTLGWGEDVIELAYDDEFGEEDLQPEQKQPPSVGATRRRSSSISGGREEERERPKGKKRISSPIRVSPTAEEPYLSRHSGRGDRNRHHWKQSVLPPSLANRLGPKEFRGLKSRGLGSTSKGSAEEIARRHRMMRGQHGGEGSQGQRRRTDRKMR